MTTSFAMTRWRPGYDIDQVDAFVATIGSRTADEVRRVEFGTTRFAAGYEMRQVDTYLDACIAQKQVEHTS